ncbi:hypothetical protein SYK_24630 [Pseudodesulfovibrio nedwellii]|uniref:Uncharacterized protein n=1 Tax=Pseudodesulfovibrio nedwellii TaxID=2973072 RepID=A0ABN6S7G8_9BACT|nr:hypothetical protein [Pseudodesulfovibrio nedwellii]BDQ38103.1 hypothetical protein SYK_24630 [Pseudodesulfovibrio nedwellii]
MNPASLIPLAEPVPIHWAWFDILLIVTLTAHLLFMNALLGSAVIGLTKSLRGQGVIIKEVGMKLPPLLALTINMGVAPLLFLQVNYGHFDYVSSVIMGGWWLAVIAALMFSYYGFYIYKFKYESMSNAVRTALFAASILGLLYVGWMFSNNMTIMLQPETWLKYFNTDGAFLNWSDPVIYPRFLHFMTGALAIGGLFVALLGQIRTNDDMIDTGMLWFTRATLVNLAVGIWFLAALPQDILLAFMGRNIPATGTLIASLIAAAFMLIAGFKKEPKKATIWAIITVFFMVCTRHWLRTLYIAPWFSIESTPVTGRYGSFYLFLGFLIVGLAAMAYMIKLYFNSRQGRS